MSLSREQAYFDAQNMRLIIVGQAATAEFWDRRWERSQHSKDALAQVRSTPITDLMRDFLAPQDGPILEGGAGNGVHVAALTNSGYCCIGVDSAPRTVQRIKETLPELDVRLGDVRNLSFGDEYFAGYFSGGVIEHFWGGYAATISEMSRVLAPGGYLFVTFPYMSPLRRLKAWLGLYRRWESDGKPDGFYQFILDHRQVIQDLESLGFELVYSRSKYGLAAIQEELGPLNPLLRRLYTYTGGSVVVRGVGLVLSKVSTPWCGHLIWLVCRKKGSRLARSG